MAVILSPEEVADALRYETPDECPDAVALVPAIAETLKESTGYNWESDEQVDETAKQAARMLLVQWFENPGMLAERRTVNLSYGLTFLITQLQVKALKKEDEGDVL